MNAATHPFSLDRAAMSAVAPHPDADLIVACSDHAKAHGALCGTPDNSPEEAAYVDALDRITGVIPQTFGGIIALTDAIMREAVTPHGDLNLEGNIAEEWCFQVVQALHAAMRPNPVIPPSEVR